MTPFGVRLRQLRAEHNLRLKDMAEALGVSGAYLSALEHGRRGRPTHAMVVAICAQLNIIWDEADELMRLARLSHPRITVDTAGLSSEATELANLLADRIRKLPAERVARLLEILKSAPQPAPRRKRRKVRLAT
ncbi:MAG TPA: helix-turn-helix domain-containing protein [Stellaceae bacterium]|nr:helix-turn-helix domain-containing protein [Stellaceae bacterium]